MTKPSTFSEFAAYLLDNRLDDFVAAQIKRIVPYDLPLMRFFAHLSAEELHALSRESVQAWLTAVREGRMISYREAELQKWRDNQLGHDIGRENITLTDVIQGYAAQRATLLSFLGEFATTVAEYSSIALEIEEEYRIAEKSALDLLEDLASEKSVRLAETTQQLEEHRARIDGLIAHAPDAVVVIDEESMIRLWNAKAETVFGWSESEAVGRPLAETIIPPAFREAHRAGMARHLSTGEVPVLHQMLSLTALHKDGHEFPISLTISGFRQAGKQHFVAFMRDITAQRRTEAALEEHRKQLEVRAEELEQYAWLVSHDLKEPLRKITLFADILERRFANDLPAEAADYVHRMLGATSRMSAVIDAVLAYAHVSRSAEEKTAVCLADAVADALTNLELLVADNAAQVEVRLDGVPAVQGVSVQLTQVFENLLANAMKYRAPGIEPRILVEGLLENGRVIATVRDNGVGFHPDYAEKIFAPFQRLESPDGAAGTGIGLALCRKIIDVHGGRIWAESAEGAGSTFFVELLAAE